jgi:hypothetical protein
VDIGLTLKNCGRFDESEVGLQNPDGGLQESDGFDTWYVVAFYPISHLSTRGVLVYKNHGV